MGRVGLDRALALFAVPEADVAAVRAAADAVRRDPALAAWVGESTALLEVAMGSPSPGPTLPTHPLVAPSAAKPGPNGRSVRHSPQHVGSVGGPVGGDLAAYLPVVAFARVLPALLAGHEQRGVPPRVTADTLADVGRMLTRNRAWFGEAGIGDELTRWLSRHLYGALYQLGRLQYERRRLAPGPGLELRQAGFPCGPGNLVLDLHIPGAGGPLAPEAVDASLAAARAFFRKRFPEERYAAVVCHSWLLDPQLATVLPASSNLVAFQRRLTLGGEPGDGDLSVRRFVWDDVVSPRELLPRDSTLRRAVVDLWASGGHWHDRRGWLAWR